MVVSPIRAKGMSISYALVLARVKTHASKQHRLEIILSKEYHI